MHHISQIVTFITLNLIHKSEELTLIIYLFFLRRKYLVLVESNLYYYASDYAATNERNKPQNFRPIELYGYESHTSFDFPYTVTLLPVDPDDDRRIWTFRCDTIDEAKVWTGAFDAGIQAEG